MENYNRLSNQILLPNAEADLQTFYDTEIRTIRPQFSWYIECMRSFPNSIENLDEGAGEILTALEEKMDGEQLEMIQQDSLEDS